MKSKENTECRVGNVEPEENAERGMWNAELNGGESEPGLCNPQSAVRNSFRWTGRDWEVVWNGEPAFYLPDTLGAKYLDFLLHRPDLAISCFELELAIQPEKGQARTRNSIQPESDARARREYRHALKQLEA